MRSHQTFTVEHGTFWVCLGGALSVPPGARPQAFPPRVEARFRELGPGDLERLTAAMGRGEPEKIRRRFETGRRCFGFEADGRIVSFGWVTPGAEETGELERMLAVPAGEAYVWDCGTVPDHRQLGLYSALLNATMIELLAEGVPRIWIGASRLNEPSIRGITNAGFRHVIDLTYRRFGRLTWISLRPAPDAHDDGIKDAVADARRILLRPGELALGPYAIGWLA